MFRRSARVFESCLAPPTPQAGHPQNIRDDVEGRVIRLCSVPNAVVAGVLALILVCSRVATYIHLFSEEKPSRGAILLPSRVPMFPTPSQLFTRCLGASLAEERHRRQSHCVVGTRQVVIQSRQRRAVTLVLRVERCATTAIAVENVLPAIYPIR